VFSDTTRCLQRTRNFSITRNTSSRCTCGMSIDATDNRASCIHKCLGTSDSTRLRNRFVSSRGWGILLFISAIRKGRKIVIYVKSQYYPNDGRKRAPAHDYRTRRTNAGFKNPMVRIALDKQVKQMQELQKQIGKKRVQDAFDSQPLNQDQHDYIYLRMAWL